MSDRATILARMTALVGGKQQMVVLCRRGAGWATLHRTGAGWDFTANSPRLAILKAAEAADEPVMVLDARVDERLLGFRECPFRSALCIPISMSWGVAALIFAEEPERVQAFTFRQLAPWLELAQELKEFLPTTRPDIGGIPAVSPKFVGGVAAVLLGCMTLSWALQPPPPLPRPKPKFEVIKPQEMGADQVLNGYLQALSMGQTDTAYLLLESKLRGKTSLRAFTSQVQTWLKDPKVVTELRARKAVVTVVGSDRCRVAFQRDGVGNHKDGWEWALVAGPEGWRLETILCK